MPSGRKAKKAKKPPRSRAPVSAKAPRSASAISGLHALLYTPEPEKLRAFFRDVLGFPSVDAGHGWLIFALPPAELGIHPSEGGNTTELYLMCDDVRKTVAELTGKGVEMAGPVREEPFGLLTAIKLPGGGQLGLYQPKHPTALKLSGQKS
jgi:catechol 2,3-dioxygenase-like lactoylglutathione lyase family enzyme